MKTTYSDFLDTVKVLRMLYGVGVATQYFEKNFKEFTGFELTDLYKLKQSAKLQASRSINIE